VDEGTKELVDIPVRWLDDVDTILTIQADDEPSWLKNAESLLSIAAEMLERTTTRVYEFGGPKNIGTPTK
jgi:hypothetical protein